MRNIEDIIKSTSSKRIVIRIKTYEEFMNEGGVDDGYSVPLRWNYEDQMSYLYGSVIMVNIKSIEFLEKKIYVDKWSIFFKDISNIYLEENDPQYFI